MDFEIVASTLKSLLRWYDGSYTNGQKKGYTEYTYMYTKLFNS